MMAARVREGTEGTFRISMIIRATTGIRVGRPSLKVSANPPVISVTALISMFSPLCPMPRTVKIMRDTTNAGAVVHSIRRACL